MKNLSIDNGNTFVSPEEALKHLSMETISFYMVDNVREFVHACFKGDSDADFIRAYLLLAPEDLIIG